MSKKTIKDFAKAIQGKKTRVWKNSSESVFSREDLFRCLVTQGERARHGVKDLHNFQFGQHHQNVEDESLLPSKADKDIDQYYQRVSKSLNHEKFYLALHALEQSSPDIWLKARSFAKEICDVLGVVPNATSVGSFMGDGDRTPFGVHTDYAGIFTFIVAGEKHMRVWPRKALEGDFPNLGRRARPMLLEYERYLASSQLLKGMVGDMFYWPDTFWHVGEGIGAFNATMTIGFDFRPATGYIIGSEPLKMLVNPDDATAEPTGYHFKKDSIFPDEFLPFVEKIEDAWLIQQTSYGLRFPIPEIRRKKISKDASVKLTSKKFPILTRTRSQELAAFANGHQFSLPAKRGMAKMIGLINKGAPIRVSSLRKASGLNNALVDEIISLFQIVSAISIYE